MAVTFAELVGALTLAAGIALVGIQFWLAARYPTHHQPSARGMTASAGPVKFEVKTTFPGLLVAGFGVILVIVGATTGR